MIRVFISYCNESDGETATSLYHYLDQEEKIEPILAPIDREIVIENAEKIANEIDICNYFITFYTSDGKENIWVNQELGYAFNHVRQNGNGFEIIPIYNKRNDFEGFLTSKSHNFYDGFCLDEGDHQKTMNEIKNYLTEKYKHPIELGFEIDEIRLEPSQRHDTLKAIISIYNDSSKKIQDATLDIVLPTAFDETLSLGCDSTFINTKYESKILPKFHSKKIRIESTIERLNVLLKDILGLNSYEIPLDISISKNYTKIYFVIYINIPLFGAKYYQLIVEKNESDWELSDFYCLKDYSDKQIKVKSNYKYDFE